MILNWNRLLTLVCAWISVTAPCGFAQTAPATLPDLRLTTNGTVNAIAVQPDGKIIIGGAFTAVNGAARTNLARLNSNGSVDATWDASTDGSVNALVISNKTLFVGGNFTIVRFMVRGRIAKIPLDGDGRPDPDWNPNANAEVGALALSGSELYAGGAFTSISGRTRSGLARLATAGTGVADENWNPSTNSPVRAIVIDGGDVYVGGDFTSIAGQQVSGLARLTTTGAGTVDPAWHPNANNSVGSIVVTASAVFAGGSFSRIGGVDRPGVAKLLLASGDADAQWNVDLRSESNLSPLVEALALANGQLYIGGIFASVGGAPKTRALVRVNPQSGAVLDAAWTPNPGTGVRDIVVTSTSVLVGGDFTHVDEELALGIARINLVGGAPDTDFAAQVQSPGQVLAMARQSDGQMILGGNFRFGGDTPRQNLLRLRLDGTIDEKWQPEPSGPVYALALKGNEVFVGGFFESIGGAARSSIAKVSAVTGAADPDWNPGAVGVNLQNVTALAVGNDSVYVGGFFTQMGGLPRKSLAKVSISGSGAADPGWTADVATFANPGNVQALVVDGTKLYVGGTFTDIAGISRGGLARVSATGTANVDTAWDASADNSVLALVLDGSSLYVGGRFEHIGGIPRNELARISTTGNGVPDFDWLPPTGGEFVASLAVSENSVYAGGDYGSLDTANGAAFNLARFPKVGDPNDPLFPGTARAYASFKPDPSDAVSSLLVHGEDLLAGGAFTVIGGLPRTGFAFLPVADPPTVVETGERIVITRSSSDGPEVTHFRVMVLSGGKLFQLDGVTPVVPGDFVTVAQGAAGLRFVSDPDFAGPQTLSVVSALDAIPAAAGLLSTTITLNSGAGGILLQFSEVVYEGTEGEAAKVLVQKIGTGGATVTYATSEGTATAFSNETGGDFIRPLSGTLSFTSNETSKEISIPLFDDQLSEGDESFLVRLTGASVGATIGSPAVATVQIIDNDVVGSSESLLDVTLPSPLNPPDSEGILSVHLEPPAALGQWRLQGERAWRNSDTAMTGLTTGNYVVEFKAVNGYNQPERTTVAVTSGTTSTYTATYQAAVLTGTGTLRVVLEPQEIASAGDPALRAQWRRGGESVWHDSDETLADIPAGSYDLEFKAVPGRVTPDSQSVFVAAGQENSLVAVYLVEEPANGIAPTAIDFNTATGQEPYLFNGQIQTSIGFASGVTVKPRTVLTAAHVLFDDANLTYVTEARWFHQRQRDEYEPVPLVARGWYVFDGYSRQRSVDATPGISTPASQNLDVAALYFTVPAARGGAGGYLASDASPNQWLLGDRQKFVVGYPVKGVPEAEQGRLFATAPSDVVFAHLYNSVFQTTALHGFPGQSGGPLYVQADNGSFYPAAIYLGGAGQALVRAIDRQVVNLINRAETRGNGGPNNTSGGIARVSPGETASAFATGTLACTRVQPTALPGAGWRLQGETAFRPIGSGKIALPSGRFVIEFAPVEGFATPAPKQVEVISDQDNAFGVQYIVNAAPVIRSSLSRRGIQGESFDYQIGATAGPTSYAATGLPAGLTIDRGTGHIGGSPSATGTFLVTISATNAIGTTTSQLQIDVAAPGRLTVTIVGSGRVSRGFAGTTSREVGRRYSVAAKALPGFVFDGWTGDFPTPAARVSFEMQPEVELRANFIATPFPSAAGRYAGLVHADTRTHASSGFMDVSVTRSGSFTLALRLAGKTYRSRGSFDSRGNAQTTFRRSGLPLLGARLSLDVHGGGTLSGTLTEGDALLANIEARRAGFNRRTHPLPEELRGAYTIVLSANLAEPNTPRGHGFGRALMDAAGQIRFAGILGDGTAASQGVALSSPGEWPFYVTANRGREVALGTIVFREQPQNSAAAGAIDWFKLPDARAAFYPDGFAAEVALKASHYAPPPFNFTAARLTFESGGLTADPLINDATLDGKGGTTISAQLTLKMATESGIFKGSFTDSGSGAQHGFAGAVFQATGEAFGLFVGDNRQTGSVKIAEKP